MNLNVYYDLNFAPVTFDFAVFLVVSNAVRQEIGAESMSVEIICNQFRNWSVREKNSSTETKRWRVSNILSKLPFLIPETKSLKINEKGLDSITFPSFPGGYPPPNAVSKEYRMPYLAKDLKYFYNKSINLRPFKASKGAKNFISNLFDQNTVTISLRTSAFQSARNSNLSEWHKVYLRLQETKYRPIVIPDFEDFMGDKIFKKFDWEIFEPAIFDLDLRMALYERSFDNLAINNGTTSLLNFSNCSYKEFKFVTSGIPTTEVAHHKLNLDISYGENLKFCNPQNQLIIWEDDNSDTILSHLEYI